MLYSLCDFTAENGATRVVPGSHLWPAKRKPQEHEVVAAEMKAGSAIYYLGKTLHGGGPNQTQDQMRRALFLGFSLGWLRTKENFFISTPIEAVREMPKRVQQLLGYETHGGIGVVDVGLPERAPLDAVDQPHQPHASRRFARRNRPTCAPQR